MTQTDRCKQTILETLRKTGEISSTDLNKVLKDEGYSRKAIDLAKPELEKEGKVLRLLHQCKRQTPVAHPPQGRIVKKEPGFPPPGSVFIFIPSAVSRQTENPLYSVLLCLPDQ